MIRDSLGRPLTSLRLSVTDRCNIRCAYCMPNEEYAWLPKPSILSFEELDRVVAAFMRLGVDRLRLTGGEPLLRHDLGTLVSLVGRRPGLADLALTTNGILLAGAAEALRAAGLRRVTVSLDTLRPDRFLQLTRSKRHADVLAGIDAAGAAGFESVKLNSVVIRGYNDDELVPLLEFARARGAELRFIEYMDVGGASRWRIDQVVSAREILDRLAEPFGPIEPLPVAARDGVTPPAERYRLGDGTVFGIIASTTAPFCRTCDRSRVTADGTWYLCLYAEHGVSLRDVIRSGVSDSELDAVIDRTWRARTDRGAERRLEDPNRGVLVPLEGLRADPRLEMHTRGG
jgi:GTP 3',8-cyclase